MTTTQTQPALDLTPLQPSLSGEDEGTFQTTVLERLRSLCGEHDDAKVLAEYIVVMVAGNKGKDEMAVELQPFFQDQAQAESFVTWVEECKWKFLTGGPSPAGPPGAAAAADKSAPAPPGATQAAQPAAASRPAAASSRGAPAPPLEAQAPQHVRPGPHVAVTSKVVLQPNPQFVSGSSSATSPGATSVSPLAARSASALSPQAALGAGQVAGATSAGSSVFAKAAAASFRNPVKQNKNELLESMTKQLQLILTKLNDPTLSDQTREKYQGLAQKIQMQMAKISKPQPATSLRGSIGLRRRM